MEYLQWVLASLGLIAFVRVEQLVKTLKEKKILDTDYQED